MRKSLMAVAVPVLMLLASTMASGQVEMQRRLVMAAGAVAGGGGGGMVNLPWMVNDAAGNQWMIYQQGWMRMQGNMPLYSNAAQLTINGNGLNARTNQGRLDEKTGELIIDGMSAQNINVTRRILINRADGYVRYIDIFANPGGQDAPVNIQFNTNFNYGVQSSLPIEDPKKKDHTIAWAAHLQAGKSILEMYAGKNSKIVPQINGQPQNNVCSASIQLSIPAGKQVALMHIHGTGNTPEACAQFVTGLKEWQMLADVPMEIRKVIVNVAGTQSIGDREVLRGEMLDVIELRGGDQLKGTISEKSFKLDTFYGPVELPAERIVGLINVGQFKPRQLLVTVDGEVFGGSMGRETIGIQLSSGQVTQVPLSQISRVGYRKRGGEPEEWTFDRPMIRLRSGERMIVAMPTNPIEVMTRYGLLRLKPEAVQAIALQSEDHGVHEIQLTDGSSFAGLVTADHFEMQLVGTAAQQKVSFPAAAVLRLQLGKDGDSVPDNGDPCAVLDLTNQDELVGALEGQLQLDTLFDTISINASELRSLQHAPDAGLDVQVVLWDQTTLSGQLRQPEVTCNLKSGVAVKIPVALIDHYANPIPRPSAAMVEKIKSMVTELSADDFRQRERAEQQLVAMGSPVVSVLKEMNPSQSPEAQQRIESILKQLEKKRTSGTSAAGPPGAVADQ